MQLTLVPLLAPAALLASGAAGFRNPGRRPGAVPLLAEIAALTALASAVFSLWLLIEHGPAPAA